MRQAAAGAYCCSLAYFKAIQSLQPICKPYNPCNTPTYTYIITNLHIHYPFPYRLNSRTVLLAIWSDSRGWHDWLRPTWPFQFAPLP